MSLLKKIYKNLISEKIRIKIIIVLRKIYSYSLIGSNVDCNCCNKSFKHFLPYGDSKIKRLNAACPWCYSMERTRMLWDFLSKSHFLTNNNYILHLAPNRILEDKLKKNTDIKYVSGDINPNLAMQVVDITDINFSDNSFDLIICSHVLSVVRDEGKGLFELYRVLKKGGALILMEYINSNLINTLEDLSIQTDDERIALYGQPYLQRLYGKDFSDRIKKYGFSVNEYNHTENLDVNYVKKHALQNSGNLFLCKKD